MLPALFVGLPVLVWSLDGAETGHGLAAVFRRRPFRIGFLFGLGYFIVAIHWIGVAFFIEGNWIVWAMPFAVLALAAMLALFWGFGTALAHLFWSDRPLAHLLRSPPPGRSPNSRAGICSPAFPSIFSAMR